MRTDPCAMVRTAHPTLLANPRGFCAGVDRDAVKIDFDHPLTGLAIEREAEIARIL